MAGKEGPLFNRDQESVASPPPFQNRRPKNLEAQMDKRKTIAKAKITAINHYIHHPKVQAEKTKSISSEESKFRLLRPIRQRDF